MDLHREGDQRAFDLLVERHQDSIYSFMLNNVREGETAKDLAQEVFLRVFVKLSGFRGESLFRTWLFRVARNLVVDHYRQQKRVRELERHLWLTAERGEEVLSSPDDGSAPADMLDSLEAKETTQKVRRALRELPEKMRNAVILYDLEGLSCDEVARALGCPAGTVKSRLFNGRLRLRELLEPYMEEE